MHPVLCGFGGETGPSVVSQLPARGGTPSQPRARGSAVPDAAHSWAPPCFCGHHLLARTRAHRSPGDPILQVRPITQRRHSGCRGPGQAAPAWQSSRSRFPLPQWHSDCTRLPCRQWSRYPCSTRQKAVPTSCQPKQGTGCVKALKHQSMDPGACKCPFYPASLLPLPTPGDPRAPKTGRGGAQEYLFLFSKLSSFVSC